jgi:hypothetical protein
VNQIKKIVLTLFVNIVLHHNTKAIKKAANAKKVSYLISLAINVQVISLAIPVYFRVYTIKLTCAINVTVDSSWLQLLNLVYLTAMYQTATNAMKVLTDIVPNVLMATTKTQLGSVTNVKSQTAANATL